MEREGERENQRNKLELDKQRNSKRLRTFFTVRKHETDDLEFSLELASVTSLKSYEVVKERPCSKSQSNLLPGQEGGGVMGGKRFLSDKQDSPSKRLRSSPTYHMHANRNEQGVVENAKNRPVSFLNTTKPDCDPDYLSEPAESKLPSVESLSESEIGWLPQSRS